MLIVIVVIFSAACLASAVLTAWVCKMAPRIDLTDLPDGRRKVHSRETPLGGGLPVFLATLGVLALLLALPNPFRADLRQNWPELVALLLAGAVIVTVGLVDDRVGLRGRQKLAGQIVAASILIAGGLWIEQIGIFGRQIALGPLSLPFTLFWLVGAINALNLLDGIDGLASILGLILVCTIALMAAMMGRSQVMAIAVVFAGGLLGFLRFNFPPAKVFLGDAGSMLIGLVVGSLAIEGSLKGAGTVLLAAPLAVWTIPVFDTTAAILRRKLTGRSIYTTDREHLHHLLLDRLGSNRKVLSWLACACAVTCAAALVGLFLKSDLIALLTCGAVVTIFIATGVFGQIEFLLLAHRLCQLGVSLLPWVPRKPARVSGSAFRLQGSRQWDPLWQTLTEAAPKLQLSRIDLDLNLPATHQRYHARWEQHPKGDFQPQWRLELPLIVLGRPAGHLTIFGRRNGGSAGDDIEPLLELLELFEKQLSALAGDGSPTPAAESLAVAQPEDRQEASGLIGANKP